MGVFNICNRTWCTGHIMKLALCSILFSFCYRRARAASAQSLSLRQRVTVQSTWWGHLIIGCSYHLDIGVNRSAHPVGRYLCSINCVFVRLCDKIAKRTQNSWKNARRNVNQVQTEFLTTVNMCWSLRVTFTPTSSAKFPWFTMYVYSKLCNFCQKTHVILSSTVISLK